MSCVPRMRWGVLSFAMMGCRQINIMVKRQLYAAIRPGWTASGYKCNKRASQGYGVSFMVRLAFAASLFALAIATPVSAQEGNSMPQPIPFEETIPAARDVDYPGVMTLKVDATDTARAIYRVEQTIPVPQAGKMTLMMPAWLPGNHAPRGQIEKLAGLVFRAGGRVLPWVRDEVNVFAFHIDVPEGVRSVTANFEFLSATKPDQGRVVLAPSMMNLPWE